MIIFSLLSVLSATTIGTYLFWESPSMGGVGEASQAWPSLDFVITAANLQIGDDNIR